MGQFTDLKITEQELADHGMTSLPGTRWTNQAQMLKAKMDEDGTFVGGRLGEVLDELEATTAAGNIGAAPFSGYDSTTVQALIEETATDLQGKIDDVIAGVLPDDSITTDKIRDDAVTEDKITDRAVTAAKIADGTITANELAQAYKDSTLASATKILLGLLTTATPNNAFIALENRINDALVGKKLASYTTAGPYTFTAPNLYNGATYEIGVVVINGGNSGAASGISSGGALGQGGSPGTSINFVKTVSPSTAYPLVVGTGGTPVTATAGNNIYGNVGGTSSFAGITPPPNAMQYNVQEQTYNTFAGLFPSVGASAIGVNMFFNPYERVQMLGIGGGARVDRVYPPGTDPITGMGGGAGRFGTVAAAYSATAPGCGGGGSCNQNGTCTSGAGAPGAVYIYLRGQRR